MGVTPLITLAFLVFRFQLPAHAQEVSEPIYSAEIVGGTSTTTRSFPWQLLVNIYKQSRRYACGGSTISLSWCMSAAHCFSKSGGSEGFILTAEKFTLYAGVTKRKDRTTDTNVQERIFMEGDFKEHLFIHPSYGIGGKFNNDITIIKLKEPWIPTVTVSPIALANLDDFIVGKKLTASGWGRTTENLSVPRPNDLQYVSGLNAISRKKCRDYWAKYNLKVTDTMICQETKDENTCAGDSGGPVITGSGESNGPPYVQIGIVSWGSNKCAAFVPKVFVEVAKFKTWIAETMDSAETMASAETMDIQSGCPVSKGFFLLPGTKRCYKLFLDVDRDWKQASTKCREEKLTMAKTSDNHAVALRELIVNTYGDDAAYAWLDAEVNDDDEYVWNGGDLISEDNELWYTEPELESDYCLVLLTGKWYMNDEPLSPYWSGRCSETPSRKAFCELPMKLTIQQE